MSKVITQALIAVFVVEPIRFKGRKVLDKQIEVTPEQLAHFQKFTPCPVRVIDSFDEANEQLTDGDEPATTGAADSPAQVSEPKPEPEPTIDEQILAALEHLDHDDDAHWTKKGDPDMKVLEGIMGDESITRAQVNEAAPDFKRNK